MLEGTVGGEKGEEVVTVNFLPADMERERQERQTSKPREAKIVR